MFKEFTTKALRREYEQHQRKVSALSLKLTDALKKKEEFELELCNRGVNLGRNNDNY